MNKPSRREALIGAGAVVAAAALPAVALSEVVPPLEPVLLSGFGLDTFVRMMEESDISYRKRIIEHIEHVWSHSYDCKPVGLIERVRGTASA